MKSSHAWARERGSMVPMISFICWAAGDSAPPCELRPVRVALEVAEDPDSPARLLRNSRTGIALAVSAVSFESLSGILARPATNAPADAIITAAAVSGIPCFIGFC